MVPKRDVTDVMSAFPHHATNISRASAETYDVINSIHCSGLFISRDVIMNPANHSTAVPTVDKQSNNEPFNYLKYSVADLLWIFVGPIIFALGLCGSAMILLVMTRRRMRGTSTCVYLTLMALADSMVLITGMPSEWLEASRFIVLKETHPAVCKLEKFLFYTSGDTAVWILVIFTVDRFIAVCFPLKKNNFCLSSRARYVPIAEELSESLSHLSQLSRIYIFLYWLCGAVASAFD